MWGHGGASVAFPMNSIAAFREAVRLGADGTELDVRRCGDGALAVTHDPTLPDGRMLKDAAVGDLPPEVPLLGAALDACDGMTVNIEIKNVSIDPDYDPDHYLAAAVASLVGERRLHDRVVVSSFGLDTVDAVAKADGDIQTALLASPRADQLEMLRLAVDHGHGAFHPYHLCVNAELVDAAHDAGLAVNVWTVDEPDRIRWLADLGVDAVITNVPDIAIAALRDRAARA